MFLTRDLVGGLGTIVVGAVYFFYATQIRRSALDDTVGPAGLPQTYGIIMIGLGVAIAIGALVKIWRQRRAAEADRAEAGGGGTETPAKGEWDGQGTKILWASGYLVIGIGYLSVVSYIGYAASIALLLIAAALYQGAPRDWRAPVVALLGAAGLWAVFVLLLGVSMPHGSLLPF